MGAFQDDMYDIRCVFCGCTGLRRPDQMPVADGIRLRVITCSVCGAGSDVIDGVPFFGEYDQLDFLGLVEIVATAKMNEVGFSIEPIRSMHRLLGEYHRAEDKAQFANAHPNEMLQAPWWPYRYHEWLQNHGVIAELSLAGKTLLNVGAGIGVDSVSLVDAGALVTCIDYSPLLTATGKRSLPAARWVGGFSHALPFQDNAFDIVCANAALHHMRSVPAALREMLRVLKPGGFLFTTGDPIRSDASGEEQELAVFDRHQGVLAGINERIVPFGSMYDTYQEFGDKLEISMIADVPLPEQLQGATIIAQGQFNDAWVPLDAHNVEQMRQTHGSVAFLVEKKQPFEISAGLLSRTMLSAGTLASWAHDGSKALAKLMPYAPKGFVDKEFPGSRQTWFDLLNGWTKPVEPYDRRLGFNRARWLLSIPDSSEMLSFKVRSVTDDLDPFEVLIDGQPVQKVEIGPQWQEFRIPIDDLKGGAPALFELRWAVEKPGANFEDKTFEVSDRAFI